MSPNRIVAATLVALLAVQLPGPVSAQVGSPDLIIDGIDVGALRVALVEAPLNVTVKNIGSGNFAGTTGWMIFVGLNGNENNDCIEKGSNANPSVQPSPATSPCYILITPGNTQGRPVSIPAGGSATYSLLWNAERRDANASAIIYAEILLLQGTPGGDPAQCAGPDGTAAGSAPGTTPACANNQYARTGVFIGEPGVRSVPVRDPSPSADGGNINDAWKEDEIKSNVCPEAPKPLERGCKVPAGRSIAAHYRVTNVGTVDDSYTPDLVGSNYGGPNGLLTRGYTFNFAPHTFSLAPGQNREVKLTIFIPENITAGNATNLDNAEDFASWRSTRASTVDTGDDDNPGCLDAAVKDYCVHPSLPTFMVDHRRAFNATSNYTFDDMNLSETSEFLINITNEGNSDDEYNLTFVKLQGSFVGTINDSWTPRIGEVGGTLGENARVFINKGENKTVRVQITPPRNVTNGTHSFEVRVKSFADETAPCKRYEATVYTPMNGECIMRFYAHVRQRWEISGSGDVAQRVVPGETRTYDLGIRNSGNGYDNVSLELQTTVFGWDVRLSNTTVRLTPFNTTTFTLTVTSPPNTPENTIGAFYLNATSGGPIEMPIQDRSKATIESLMTIIRGSNIRLDAPVNTSFVDAGAQVTYTVLVTNIGNIADNFTIEKPEGPSDWGVDFTPSYLELQPLQQGSFTVKLTAPSAAVVGEKAVFIAKVRSTVDRSRDQTLPLEARVSGPDLFVDNVLVNSSNPYSGDDLEVGVVLGNSGNKAHDSNITLRVYFLQGGVERVIGEKSYPAAFIGSQRRLTETFAWETDGIEGAGVLLARIDVGDRVKEIDDSPASNEKTRALTLRTFDIKITPAAGLSARPGERLKYSEAPNVFTLRYGGNQVDGEPVTVRIESEHGWLASQQELALRLPRAAEVSVTPELDIPLLPGAARDTLTITVIPSLRPDEVLRATAVTIIIDEEKPIVKSITATPPTATLGESVTLDIFTEDATGASTATAYVTFPTNETSAVPLTKVGPDHFRGDRIFTVAGRYRVAVEVLDSADPPNKNDTRLALGSFVMSPGSAPTVRLATGQLTTIRTGSPIALDIRDPLGIGKVTYSIKGVTYDLAGPAYRIDTSTLTAGTVEINVTAENIYGVATSQKFSFAVDNAAPGITRVAINPERPRANQDVTVTVQTEAKVEAVDVLVKRDGQVVQTLNATKRGVGSFAVTFNPAEGDYIIDVTARDAAGNTRLEDEAVVFSAKPGSLVPAPSIGIIALAAVALALATRRRT